MSENIDQGILLRQVYETNDGNVLAKN